MINRNIMSCKLVLLSFLLFGCGYTQLDKNQRLDIPIFSIEGFDTKDEVLLPVEVFDDTSEITTEYIIIGSIRVEEKTIHRDDKQDERIYNKLLQKASLTEADAISNLRYYFRNEPFPYFYSTSTIIENVADEIREAEALLVKFVKNIETTDHIYLKFNLREPALITVILYDLKGSIVTQPFNSHKQFVEWGPLIYYKKDFPSGYYRLYTKGVHYYNDVVLWEKSKWIRRNKN